MTSFVGRRREVTEIKRLLSTARLVTLTGVGGTGKTRLAVRVAGELWRAFPDGVWQVDLAGLRDGALCAYAVVEAFGISGETDPPLEVLARHLAERKLLLVLDNCEHLLDACAQVVEALLAAAPELRVMCTSRQPMGMVGEALYVVPPLAVPRRDAPLPAGDDSGHAALTLFVERAGAVLPGFKLTPDNQHAVVEICARLDGLPLAIELAAVQVRVLSVEELSAGLTGRFQLLTARYAVPAHHCGLRDTFDWSFSLCSAAEQALWGRLAVFDGTFDLDAVVGVCADEDLPAEAMRDLMAGLVDKSIVLRDDDPAGHPRYRLLETVREYGRQKLSDDLLTTLRRRHRDWYLSLAERFNAEWFGPDQRQWAQRLRADLDNLRTAMGWCLETPGEAQAGLRLAAALWFYWTACGGLSEGRYWLGRALAADPAPTEARTAALSAYTRVLIAQADHAAAAASIEDGLAVAHQLGDPCLIALATRDLGMHLLMASADLPRVQAVLEDAQARCAKIDCRDPASLAVIRLLLAITRLYQGDREQAAQLCADCEAFCRAHGERWWRASVLSGSAMVALARDDPAQAVGYLRDSLSLQVELGDLVGIGNAIELLGAAAAAAGDLERAAVLTGVAHQCRRELGESGGGPRRFREWVGGLTDRVRNALGEREYDAAYRRGWELPLDAAVTYALGAQPPRGTRSEAPSDSPLTPREQQVAELIAESLSNRQIASRLMISQRTAESHVENILRKLGFTSRAQVAVWVSGHAGKTPSAC